jgi:hypothetical protein
MLRDATLKIDVANRIMAMLPSFSNRKSVGLPVGGNAARILAEASMTRVDQLLAQKIVFLRFVDDYYLFANSNAEAKKSLVFLSQTLLENEGLTLAKSKTRLMTKAEFLRSSPVALVSVAESKEEANTRKFCNRNTNPI